MARGTILNRIHEIEIHRDQTLNEWSENDKFFKDCKKEIAVIESQPIGFSAAAEIEIEKNILVAGGVLWTTIHPILMADCGNGICRFGWKGRNLELIRHELNGHKLLSGMPIFTHNWLVLLLLCGSASIDCWMAGIRLIVVWRSNFIKTMRNMFLPLLVPGDDRFGEFNSSTWSSSYCRRKGQFPRVSLRRVFPFQLRCGWPLNYRTIIQWLIKFINLGQCKVTRRGKPECNDTQLPGNLSSVCHVRVYEVVDNFSTQWVSSGVNICWLDAALEEQVLNDWEKSAKMNRMLRILFAVKC